MGEGGVCAPVLSNGELDNDKSPKTELKRNLHCVVTDSEEESCKKRAKDASNDDICSVVTESIASPRENENTSIMHVSGSISKALEVDNSRNNQDNSGEITSLSAEMLSDEDNSGPTTSHIILEIPKHSSTTGIRKITFKFSKSKQDCTSNLSNREAQQSLSVGIHRGDLPVDDFRNPHNMELKMSKKVLPNSYPTNVKKLLSTGILEGAKVKYITTSRDVLSAYEFEKHAGGAKTRHPNNHIHLENGKPIYSIIEELKTSPLGLLENVVKDIAGPSVNELSFQAWKAKIQESDDPAQMDHKYQRKSLTLTDSLVSCTNMETGVSYPALSSQGGKAAKQPGKRPKSSAAKLCVLKKKGGEGGSKKRDNDLHRLLFMPNGLPDGADLVYSAKGQKILHGTKQGNGILCDHCNREISPSQFESHAGWAARRQPYRHIFTSNGLSLHDIAISLSNGQSLTTGHSDDMCTTCGNGGQLTLCCRCPRAYHAACLGSQFIARDDWSCPDCVVKASSGDTSSNNTKPIIIRLTRVVKEVEFEHGGCVICRSDDFSSETFDDRTVIICDQCEKEYHVNCLRDNGLCDLKALPDGDWFCSGDCSRIHDVLWEQFVKGMQMVPTSVFSRTLLPKGLCNVSEDDVQWLIINGSKRSNEHLPLLSRATAIFREQFNPIVSSSGRDLIPVMVYGRNISGQEFGGMYTVLLLVKSVVVSAGLVRIFCREAAELPLVATSKENQGKGYFQALFSCIEGLLSSLNVETLVLPAAEEAKSIWTDKFGFRTMTHERVFKYRRSYQLTAFSGTSWLEKPVRQAESLHNEAFSASPVQSSHFLERDRLVAAVDDGSFSGQQKG
ncbi:hypothetical protein V2J09_010383 [Rumex salicifolius]